MSDFSNFCFAKMLLISRSAKSHHFRVRCRIDASYIITFGGFGSYRIFVLFSFSSITFSSSFFYKRMMNIAVDFLSILSLHIIVSPMPSHADKMFMPAPQQYRKQKHDIEICRDGPRVHSCQWLVRCRFSIRSFSSFQFMRLPLYISRELKAIAQCGWCCEIIVHQ